MASMGGPGGPIDQSSFRFGQQPQQGTWGLNNNGQAQQFNSGTSFETWTPEKDAANQSAGGVGQYRAGGPNNIVWGGEVTEGSSGGETSYNAATGKQQYIAGYDNTGWSPAGAPQGGGGQGGGSGSLAGLQAAGAPAGDVGSGGGDFAAGALAEGGGSGEGPGGAKVIDPASDNSSPAMQGLMAAGGADAPGANMLAGPTHFRQGIGARMIPNQDSPLAGLRRAY